MRYLLDTSTCSDLMSDHAATLARLATAPDREMVITCSIVRGELLYGVQRLPAGHRRDRLSQRAAGLLDQMKCESVSASAADQYALLKKARERLGKRMDENDLWIAATALSLGATLVTRDSDYEGIEGLQIEDWSKP